MSARTGFQRTQTGIPAVAKILVVDDDQDMRETLSHALLRYGYSVMVARTGQLALELAREHQPHVVLTDSMLSLTDGRALCQRIKHESPATRIVLMTTQSGSRRRFGEEFNDWFVDGLLPKPFDLDALLETVGGLVLQGPRQMPPISTSLFPDPRQASCATLPEL